jgi:hypothetical protein
MLHNFIKGVLSEAKNKLMNENHKSIKKRWRVSLICTLYFSITIVSYGQFVSRSINLDHVNKLHHIEKVPFNKVVIIDDRYDTNRFLIDVNPDFQPVGVGFKKNASIKISDYIQKTISPYSKKNGTIYIRLLQLRFGNLPLLSETLFFNAEAFVQTDIGYVKIFCRKKKYSFRQRYKHAIGYTLSRFVEGICKSSISNLDTNVMVHDFSDLSRSVMDDWGLFPIVKASDITSGIFTTLNDFLNNNAENVDFRMHLQADSTYAIQFVSQQKYYQTENGNVKHIWAVAYHDTLFLPILGRYFLPLNKKNNAFYFHVPQSFPDMYTILYRSRMESWGVNETVDASGTDPGTAIAGILLSAINSASTKLLKSV